MSLKGRIQVFQANNSSSIGTWVLYTTFLNLEVNKNWPEPYPYTLPTLPYTLPTLPYTLPYTLPSLHSTHPTLLSSLSYTLFLPYPTLYLTYPPYTQPTLSYTLPYIQST